MYSFLERHWVAGAILMAAALTAAAPVAAGAWPLALWLVYLHSPVYMIHQTEEHVGDRFRAFVNQRAFGGRKALTAADVIWINVGGVWGANLAALYAARFLAPGWGLAAPYLMIVNAVSHIGAAARFGYNPGLVTSLVVFLPLGLATLWLVPATLGQHLFALGVALAVHAAIVLNVLRRLRAA